MLAEPRGDDATILVCDLALDFHVPGALQPGRVLRALDQVDLDIRPGEIIGLVGESGSGKTTLGKTILGVHRPSAGRILYRGRDLTQLSSRERMPFMRDLQMVFQDPLSSFNPRFTIASSLAVPLRLHRVCPRDRIAAQVEALLRGVGLGPEYGARYPHELSGGQLQRVAIARAISVGPEVVVADEAVSKLDVSVRAQVLNLLKRMNRETGAAIVFITHDLGVARFLCDRIAVMFFGRILEIGRTEEVFGAPRHPYTSSLVEARRAHSRPVSTDADEAALAIPDTAQACNYAPRCSRRVPACIAVRPQLASEVSDHRFACFVPLTLDSASEPSRRPLAGTA